MKPLKPFEASRLKLKRAQRHIDEFRTEATKFLESDPVSVVVEEIPDLTHINVYGFIARVKSFIPHDLSTVIGDAIHNLRTSLDVMACDLVRLNSHNAEKVYFPFAQNANELDGEIRRKRMDRASPEAIKLLRSLKPYTGGNAQLRGLHDLDIHDKHKALLPSISAVELPAYSLRLGNHVNSIPAFTSAILKDGQYLTMLPRSLNLPVGTKIPIKIGLVWESDTPFPGLSVLGVLEDLAKLAKGTLEAFADLYPRDQEFPVPATPKKDPLVKGLILAPPGSMNHGSVGR